MPFSDICSGFCAESVSDMTLSNDLAVGARGVLRLPPYSFISIFVDGRRA